MSAQMPDPAATPVALVPPPQEFATTAAEQTGADDGVANAQDRWAQPNGPEHHAMDADDEAPMEEDAEQPATAEAEPQQQRPEHAEMRSKSIDDEFDRCFAAPQKRVLKRKTGDGQVVETADAPAPPAASAWLKGVLAQSLRVFGEHMDKRMDDTEAEHNTVKDEVREQAADMRWMHYNNIEHFKTIADRLDRTDHEVTELAKRLNKRCAHIEGNLQNINNAHESMRADNEQIRKDKSEVDERIASIESQLAAINARLEERSPPPLHRPEARSEQWLAGSKPEMRGVPPAEPQPWPQRPARTETARATSPPPPRKLARLGNLGWDTESSVLPQRGKEVMASIRYGDDTYTSIHAVTGRGNTGSVCEVMFHHEDQIAEAKTRLRNKPTIFMSGKFV